MQKTSAENKCRKQPEKNKYRKQPKKQINNNLKKMIMELYLNLNVHTTGTITIKNTRKKLYNYMLTDCSKDNIKKYLLKYKDTTVFCSAKSYAPELKNYMVCIKATNFEKHASIKDKETFKKQRSNFLNS